MTDDPIPERLGRVSEARLRRDLYTLSQDPLPHRKLNAARPGQTQSTLEEADAFLTAELEACGYAVEREPVEVRAFRFAPEKPLPHKFHPPAPDDPRYTAFNLYAERTGTERPDEILLLLAHKDSQSWVDSPGANDNASGTVSVLEIARALCDYVPRRTLRFLFCNEEHTPWTSAVAARNARERGDRLVAVINQDSPTGRSAEDRDAGRKPLWSVWTEPEGEALARLTAEVNVRYGLGLETHSARRDFPNDDDGSFVKAGYPAAVIQIGSWPYAEPNYHTEGDTPDTVDPDHLARVTRATLALLLTLER